MRAPNRRICHSFMLGTMWAKWCRSARLASCGPWSGPRPCRTTICTAQLSSAAGQPRVTARAKQSTRCSVRPRARQIDVYAQIGFVMLVGLAAKNAILIVEFAKRRREEGNSILDAAMEAARLRLRPILMTAFAFILGVVPLMIATGAGASARQSIGTTVFGGMLVATVLSLGFVPVFYAVIERLREGTWGESEMPGSRRHRATEAD